MNRNTPEKDNKNGQQQLKRAPEANRPSYNGRAASVRTTGTRADNTEQNHVRPQGMGQTASRTVPETSRITSEPQKQTNTASHNAASQTGRQRRTNASNQGSGTQTNPHRLAPQNVSQKAEVGQQQKRSPSNAQTQRPDNAASKTKAKVNSPVRAPQNKANTRTSTGLLTRIKKSITAPPSQESVKRHKNDFIKPTDVVRIKGSYDKLFLILVIILTLFGIIMDFSASYAYAYSKHGDSFYFVRQQVIFACIGMVALIVAMHFDYRWLRKVTVPIFIVVILLLLAVLMYGVASGVAQRWITIGPITFQPSEFMKPALVLMLALYVARNQDRITNYRNFKQSTTYGMIIPFMIVGVACILIALEKHFSGTIIVFAIGAVVIFAAGARMKWFVGAVITAVVLLAVAIAFVPYAQERIDMLINPENYDPTGKIWQTLQGLYAIGSGGLFGVGLGNSRQKHMYVSQPQNDFIFSIIAEELGFAGAALVIILFMLLIWRGFVIALKAPDTFSSLVVIGLISKVAIQAILNIAVVTNTIPNTGISLPFFSYGGTALVVQLAEMGAILSISRYSYQKKDALE